MTYLANRLSVIKPSPTLAIMGEASKRKALGEDIIILAAGEPDFDTPDHIKEAATQGMREGKTKYTAVDGMPDLKKAVQKKFFEDNGLSYDLSEILVGVGGKQVIFNALMATCNEGDEVIIPAPYWVSYPDMAKLFGAKPVFISCSEKDHFKVTPENLKKALTPKTKWLILNSPSNPTGSVYTRDELVALGNVLKDHTCLILSDDIYEYLTYDGEFVTLATACPEIKSRCLIVNGVSKAYSMTGWRIGYGAGPADLIKAMGMIQSQSTSNASSISQVAAIKALTSSRDFLGDWKKSFIERRDFCLDKINAIEGLSCRKPEGAFYLYINCEKILGKKTSEGNIIATDADFAAYLLNAVGVAVVPGDAFGLSPFVRISYATSMNELEKACQRIKKAVASLV
ncbi:MAG: pyridoxal phosphate-dependent aminotransferase [Alphaproteobacteria bacterium]|nr:pyridoxal phosphate-dependent aminotransferase [Alphaproteobacteria bacterium]